MRRKDVGLRGEELAALHLRHMGYRIVTSNWRCRFGEIDLVAENGEGLVFVEVRAKRRPSMVLPEETITRPKAIRLARLAEQYLSATGQEERPWRVDVMAVELSETGELIRLEQFTDAIADLVGQ